MPMKRMSGWANQYNLRAAAVAALVLFAITYAADAAVVLFAYRRRRNDS